MVTKDKWDGMWKEEVVVCFTVMFHICVDGLITSVTAKGLQASYHQDSPVYCVLLAMILNELVLNTAKKFLRISYTVAYNVEQKRLGTKKHFPLAKTK
jgi:hypothetical protein